MISSDPPPVVASGVSTSALPVPPEPVPPESGPTMRKPDPSFDAEIVVTLRNEAGLQIGFSKAEVLAAAWGEVRRTELPTDGDQLTLGLEELHGFLDSSFADGQHVLGVFLSPISRPRPGQIGSVSLEKGPRSSRAGSPSRDRIPVG